MPIFSVVSALMSPDQSQITAGLSLQSIGKRYKGDTVLDDINLTVPPRETLVLFGPSGAGKSVLLRLIAGVIEPDQGSISFNDRDLAGVDPEERGVGMAFQNFALFPHMSAFRNIASSLEVHEPSKSKLAQSVEAIAKLLKISHVLDHSPRELSNGQKQRTALARALVGNPSLLLLDDPLRNVDAKLRFEMRIELPALLAQQGTTVIYVTQDYKEAMALGDQIAVMDGGKIQQTGTPAQIYQQPASVDIARQFGDPAINLLDVTIQRDDYGQYVSLSGTRLPVADHYGDINGRDCTLGLRAESLSFTAPDSPLSIPVEIEAVTPLNEKIVTLALTSGNREILTSRPSGTAGPESGHAAIAIDTQAIHLFDKQTGERISPATAKAGIAA